MKPSAVVCSEDHNATTLARPTPAIVIAVGKWASITTRQVRTLYMRGDIRRAAAVDFFQLEPDAEGAPAFGPLDNTPETDGGNPVHFEADAWMASLRNGLALPSVLRSQIGRLIHEQRVHERLIAAGWGEAHAVPLNLIIVADTSDPWAAGMLLPLGAVISELTAVTPLCQAHWLFSTAVFPDDDPDLDLAVWGFLSTFDDFLHPVSQVRKDLAQALHLPSICAPDFSVYLFDGRKEGTAVVRDRISLSILAGNALLALLHRDLALRFHQERDIELINERSGYYSSIGATGIFFDPHALQQACALKIGHEFLSEQILAPAYDGQAAIQLTHHLQENTGGIFSWLNDLTGLLPPEMRQVRIDPDTLETIATFPDLNLAALDLERLAQTRWTEQLQEARQQFEREMMPEIRERLANQKTTFIEQRVANLQAALDRLPFDPGLYPGGLDNAVHVIGWMAEHFNQTIKDLTSLQTKLQKQKVEHEDQFTRCCQELHELLSSAPKLPWCLRILPAGVRQWISPIYMFRRFGRQLVRIQNLKATCLSLLALTGGAAVEIELLTLLDELPQQFQERLHTSLQEIEKLQEKIRQALLDYSSKQEAFQLEAAENGWDSLLRRPVVSAALIEWAYLQWRQDPAAWTQDFLAALASNGTMQETTKGSIIDWVKTRAEETYCPVWSLNLDAIFDLWNGTAPRLKDGDRLTTGVITACMSACTVPVRPDFDAVGGAAGSNVTFHSLIGHPEWQHCRLPEAGHSTANWQPIYTGDPFTALFLQTRRCFPLRALNDSFQSAQCRLESMTEEKRRDFDLRAGLTAHDAAHHDAGLDSRDLVQNTFEWVFRPRGSPNEFTQRVDLAISRSRFEFYRRQPRFNGQWNRYAELETPEVRALAMEFQKLHADHKWSTFNQAANVLKFVQSCIAYSSDRETTGHEDWARYPIETLVERTGDCEDVAILCAAILARLGFQVVLLLYPQHLAFGVAGADNLKGDYVTDPQTGTRYFYGEATGNGWHLGQVPREEYKTSLEEILKVEILIEE